MRREQAIDLALEGFQRGMMYKMSFAVSSVRACSGAAPAMLMCAKGLAHSLPTDRLLLSCYLG
jgi:hypothetical protein